VIPVLAEAGVGNRRICGRRVSVETMGLLARWDARNQRYIEHLRELGSDEVWLADLRLARAPLPKGSLWQRLRALSRRSNAVSRTWVRSPNAKCPICEHRVVAEPLTLNPRLPMFAPRTAAELVAACPIHGRPPYNTASRRYALWRPGRS
jgi:hypothetical protein